MRCTNDDDCVCPRCWEDYISLYGTDEEAEALERRKIMYAKSDVIKALNSWMMLEGITKARAEQVFECIEEALNTDGEWDD